MDKYFEAVVLPHGVLFRGAAEGDIADVDKCIIDQCKELGIPAPVFTGGK